jgi:hypothetical protein
MATPGASKRYSVDFRKEGAEIMYFGEITGTEILGAKGQFFRHRFPVSPRYLLCDFTETTGFDVSPDDLDALIDQDRSMLPTHPELFEVVVAARPVIYGISRMWQAKVDQLRPHTAVVKTRDEAFTWLRATGVHTILDGESNIPD